MSNNDYIEFDHWQKVPTSKWPWKHFSPQEMACRGTGWVKIHKPTMNKLETLRKLLGRPIILNSAYRSPEHNKRVGGATNSFHMKAMAYDCRMDNHDPAEFEKAARSVGFTGFGFYKRQNFMHIDTGPAREWNKRWWKPGATGMSIEQPIIETNPIKDNGVRAASLGAVALVIAELNGGLTKASEFVGAIKDLHPHAQTAAVYAGAILLTGAVVLGIKKMREMTQ